jgi:hypothetical protein
MSHFPTVVEEVRGKFIDNQVSEQPEQEQGEVNGN